MAVKVPFDAPPSKIIADLRRRNVTLPEVFYALEDEKRSQAFTVSGLAKLDQIQRVADELARHVADGGTLRDFQKWAESQDWGLPRHRLETIFRNAVQTAYNAGHWRSFEEMKATRPYLMYDAINDSRTRPSHLALDGTIRPVDDQFWETHSPPLGHRCRCTLKSLSADQARERGGVTQNPPAEGVADDGWGAKPTVWSDTLETVSEQKLDALQESMTSTALSAGLQIAFVAIVIEAIRRMLADDKEERAGT
jgi:SPP1 gp7 family putative phage head morphogenesis protein